MLCTYIQMFCRITIIIVFLVSFIGKLRNIEAFREAIIDFRLLPDRWSSVVVWISLSVELVIILLLMFGNEVMLVGFFLTIGLLAIFSIALIIVLLRKMKVRCNCFGWTEERVSFYDVVRNFLFILCGVIGAWTYFIAHENIFGGDILLLSLMAICFVLLVINLVDIVDTLRETFHAHERV